MPNSHNAIDFRETSRPRSSLCETKLLLYFGEVAEDLAQYSKVQGHPFAKKHSRYCYPNKQEAIWSVHLGQIEDIPFASRH